MNHITQVEKFGGTSLCDGQRFIQVADRLAAGHGYRVVVVSAPAGVTDALHACFHSRSSSDLRALVEAQHARVAESLVGDGCAGEYTALVGDQARLLALLQETPDQQSAFADFVSSGELWSARLLTALLLDRGTQARTLDAAEFLTVRSGELGPVMRRAASKNSLQALLGTDQPEVLVVSGYRACDDNGRVTTLSRNGSDLSASFMAALLGAESLTIWTDVDGVLNADPALVADARVVPELSYSEALELAHFGARVLHPHTIGPALEADIPIHIRNSAHPGRPGTLIHGVGGDAHAVRGVSVHSGLALINLEGAGLMGVPGTAQRLFSAIRDAGVSVVLISQAGSEHSICFLVPEADAKSAHEAVQQAFAADQRYGYVECVRRVDGVCIVAVVGAGMMGTPGIAGRFFSALGRASVNVRGIAQGSSEQNISAVIDAGDSARALRAVHAAFYLSAQTVSVGVIGTGNIGAELLRQLARESNRLCESAGVDFRVRGIARSHSMRLAERRLDLDTWEAEWDAEARPLDLDRFVDHIQAEHIPHAVLVDATADPRLAERYADWLRRGIHVVTPNKHAGSGPLRRYGEIMRARGQADFHYETTVGAGLPILQTLRDLRETGDEILSIEGMLSGTLSYLFNVYDGTRAFSEIVQGAREQGFTEPDPRDDLSGMDVARKLVILGREAGLELGIDDIEVATLVPADLQAVSLEEFLRRAGELDAPMAMQWQRAHDDDAVLRVTASLDCTAQAVSGRVGLERVPRDHPFARINLTDNIVRFTSGRYRDTPLIVQGPGAGPAVTAAGVFAELLRLATAFGARL